VSFMFDRKGILVFETAGIDRIDGIRLP